VLFSSYLYHEVAAAIRGEASGSLVFHSIAIPRPASIAGGIGINFHPLRPSGGASLQPNSG